MDQGQQEALAVYLLKQGSIAGLEPLVRLYQTRALRAAYLICKDQDMAEDIVADVFLVVYDRIDQYDTARAFAPWFYRIVTRTAAHAMRRQRRYVMGEPAAVVIAQRDDDDAPPERAVIAREMDEALMQEVNSLPVKLRTVLVLRHYLEMDERTIAGTLDIPVGTVKSRLHAGRKGLRRRVSRWIEFTQQQEGNIA